MEDDRSYHSGQLFVPPNGKLILKKTWQQKFCMLYKASKLGIERLEIYDSSDEAIKSIRSTQTRSCKIITLENCVKVAKKGLTFFVIVTRCGTYEFGTNTETSLNEWINAIQTVAFRDDVSKITTLVEDNDLYCSIGEGVFNVKLYETEASVRCNLVAKNYILVLTSSAIQLKEVSDERLLFTWPYQYIRRYGYSSGKFTFEAGRKCDSGEGKFLLEHSNEQEIFRYLTMKMKSMKKLLKTDSASSLECGDKQFQAMLNMEARSRSPLPPSPTTSTAMQDIDHMSLSMSELGEKLIKFGIDPSPKSEIQKKPLSFQKPLPPPKPPRKALLHLDNSSRDDYEDVSKYDEIEVRNNAWQTLGTTDINHSENIDDEEEEEYISWGRKSPVLEVNVQKASKIITEPDSEYDSYDKLNFFGSSSKLNVSGGYKQVRPNPNVVPNTPPSFNEYDEVHILECIRPADDSHLGYAVIRKKEPSVDHKSFNDTEYAVISKPKRV